MSEDSIISSPSKSNKSIRETWQKRKTKRKDGDQSVQIKSDHESCEGFSTLLKEFYRDSDEESLDIKTINPTFLTAKSSAVIKNFKPFELEKSLVMADRLLAPKLKFTNFPETQGFVTSILLTESDLKNDDAKTSGQNDKNSLCVITESELINCCHQAEKILELDIPTIQDKAESIVHELTPNESDNMLLVNSILIDFSQSPLSKEQIINTSWQYTPEFRLRRQPLKQYSRKVRNGSRKNLNDCFEEHSTRISSQYDDDHSSCSSLSIQEDVTICENLGNQSAITNTSNTQRLCENLLNLTEYFTQNESQGFLSEEQQQQYPSINSLSNSQDNHSLLHNIPDLIRDITLSSSHPNRKRYASYNSIDDFYGFSNNEDEHHPIGAGIGEQGVMNTNLNLTHDLTVCDVRLLNISMNDKDTNRFDDFNEDDCHDIFACIKTENILQQYEIKIPKNEISNVECPIATSTDNNENFLLPRMVNRNNTTEYIGFKTASSKPIKVSREAEVMAAKILSKLPDIPSFEENTHPSNCDITTLNKDMNLFENSEEYEWNDDCDLFLNFQTPIVLGENSETKAEEEQNISNTLSVLKGQDAPSTSKIVTLTQKSVQKLLNEFDHNLENNFNFEEELREMKCEIYPKTHNLETEKSQTCDLKQLDADVDLKTAKDKTYTIPMTADQNAKNLLNKICMESKHTYDNFETTKQTICKKNIEPNQRIAALNCTQRDFQISFNKNIERSKETQVEKNMGFHTANGKMINISNKAQKSVQKLLEEFNENHNKTFLDDLESIKNDINNENYKHKVARKSGSNNIENQFRTPTKSDTVVKHGIEGNLLKQEINMGFRTAKGKNILISDKAQKTVQKLLQEFDKDLDVGKYDNELIEMKTKIQIKNKNDNPKYDKEVNKYDMKINEWPSTTNVITEQINAKRKNSTENIALESANSAPPLKIFKNSLRTSKSLFAEQSLKSPLNSAAHSIILRKNLLSLTKRRKSKRNSLTISTEEDPKPNREICNLNVSAVTPIKSVNSLESAEQTPDTPNIREFFFNTPLTSTPQINSPPQATQTIEDSDLMPIIWKNNHEPDNKSMNTTKLSDNSTLNITLNSSNPTAKERIGRLKMYGKAPALSPILIETHHNCRPSGLRRTRSMFKKTEE